MPRPPQAGDGRVPDTGAAAQERLRHVSLDLEEAKSAAGNEWQEVAGRALRNNVLCWGLPPAGCGVAAACMACSGCFSAQCVLAATAGTLAGGAAGLAYGNFVYCREAKASATAAYVDDIETLDRFKALVEDIRKARPVLRLGIVCRHLESSTDYDSNGESSTSSYWVETHRASQDFSGFAAVFDETLSADDMWALVAENHGRIVDDELLLVQMHINALPVSDASQEELRRHAQNWFDAERCDSEQLYSWSWELDTNGSLVWPSGGRMTLISGSSRPEWLSKEGFDKAVCRGCAYCYRKKLFGNARKINFAINKHFSMPGAPAANPADLQFSVRNAVPKMAPFLPAVPTAVYCPPVAISAAPSQQNSMTASQKAAGVVKFGAQQAVPVTVPLKPQQTSGCSACGAAYVAGAKFCRSCGKVQPSGCSGCGVVNAEGARFCKGCGQPSS